MGVHSFWGIVLCRIVSLFIISCYIAGCSLYGPTKQGIGVISDPPGAQVLVSGKPMGTTPLQFEVDRGENLLLEVQKSGYHTQYRTSSRKLSGLGILDVVSGFFWLVPFVGLTASGAWEHDPSDFGVTLEPENGVTPTIPH
jgi:hypothetical protein